LGPVCGTERSADLVTTLRFNLDTRFCSPLDPMNRCQWKHRPPLVIPTEAQRSGGTCSLLLAFAEAPEIVGYCFLVAGRDRGFLGGTYLTGLLVIRIVAQLKL